MNKRLKMIILSILICFIIIPMSTIQVVNAGDTVYCPACKDNHKVEGIEGFVVEMAYDATTINFFSDDEGSGLGMSEMLKFDTTTNKIFKALWHGEGDKISVKKVNELMMPVATVIALVFFFLELSEKIFSDSFNAEQLVLSFVRLGLVLLIAGNAFEILTLVSETCTLVFKVLFEALSAIEEGAGSCQWSVVKEMNIIEQIGFLFGIWFNYLFLLLVMLMISISTWRRVFDLVIYSMFFPVGISDIVKGGLQSSGVRFIKVIAAKFLQGAVVLTIMVSYNLISGLLLTSGIGAGSFGLIILSLTVMTLTMNSGNLANSLLGV